MQTQKRILFLASTLKIGGAEKMLSDLILGVTASGYRPALICLKKLDYWGDYLRCKGVESYALGLTRASNLWQLAALISIGRQMKPQIVYSLDHRDALLWSRLLAKLLRCPHVMSQHALKIAGAEAPDRLIYKLIIKATTPLSSKIIACGTRVRDALIRGGIPARKIEVIHNGVPIHADSAHFGLNFWRSKLKIPADGKLVGIVAALRPVKAHWVFLEAAQRVLQRFPQTRFVVVGNGRLRSRLEDKTRALGIDGKVFFVGNITPATDIIRCLDIGVLSSVSEAFPITVLEYMEAGIPVVSTDCGGPGDIIRNGREGLIVPVNHPRAMAQKIIDLLASAETAARMGRQGRQRIKDHFSVEKMIDRHVAVFKRLVNESGSQPGKNKLKCNRK